MPSIMEIPTQSSARTRTAGSSDIVAPTPALTPLGHFDLIVGSAAVGWAWLPEAPTQRVTVEVMAGECVVARGYANQLRSDLQAQDIGDGQYGFFIPITSLSDGNRHLLTCRILNERRGYINGVHEFTAPEDACDRKSVLGHASTYGYAQVVQFERQFSALDGLTYVDAINSANLMLESGDIAGAAQIFVRIAYLFGETDLVAAKLADCSGMTEGLSAAVLDYQRAIETIPDSALLRFGLAEIFRRQNAWDSATRHYEDAATCFEILKSSGHPYFELSTQIRTGQHLVVATQAASSGELEEAARAYASASMLNPHNTYFDDRLVAVCNQLQGGSGTSSLRAEVHALHLIVNAAQGRLPVVPR